MQLQESHNNLEFIDLAIQHQTCLHQREICFATPVSRSLPAAALLQPQLRSQITNSQKQRWMLKTDITSLS